MIRALYTAASGMNAQQTNIDTVAHNLANVNTTGFKGTDTLFAQYVFRSNNDDRTFKDKVLENNLQPWAEVIRATAAEQQVALLGEDQSARMAMKQGCFN